jgi:hypothetical protein
MRDVLTQAFSQRRYRIGTIDWLGPARVVAAGDLFPQGAALRLPVLGRTVTIDLDWPREHPLYFARELKQVQAGR